MNAALRRRITPHRGLFLAVLALTGLAALPVRAEPVSTAAANDSSAVSGTSESSKPALLESLIRRLGATVLVLYLPPVLPPTTPEEPPVLPPVLPPVDGGGGGGGGETPGPVPEHAPEPASVITGLVGFGLAGMYAAWRRKRK